VFFFFIVLVNCIGFHRRAWWVVHRLITIYLITHIILTLRSSLREWDKICTRILITGIIFFCLVFHVNYSPLLQSIFIYAFVHAYVWLKNKMEFRLNPASGVGVFVGWISPLITFVYRVRAFVYVCVRASVCVCVHVPAYDICIVRKREES